MKHVIVFVCGILLACSFGSASADVPDPMLPFIRTFFERIMAHPEETFLFADVREEETSAHDIGYPDPELQETYRRQFNAAKTVTGREWLEHFKITPSSISFLEVSQTKPFHFPVVGVSEFGAPLHRAGRALVVFTAADEYMGEVYDVVFHLAGSGKGNEVAGIVLRAGPTIQKKAKDPCTIKPRAELTNPQPPAMLWDAVLDLVGWPKEKRPAPPFVYWDDSSKEVSEKFPGCWSKNADAIKFLRGTEKKPSWMFQYFLLHEQSHRALAMRGVPEQQHHCWMLENGWALKLVETIRKLGTPFPDEHISNAAEGEKCQCRGCPKFQEQSNRQIH